MVAQISDERPTALAVREIEPERSLALTPVSDVASALARVEQLQAFVKRVMVRGLDYGRIPGTDKDTLFKPGAEKLLELYGLAASYEIIEQVEDWERGFWYYKVRCAIRSRRTGDVVGEGLGSCNSMETKYRWRIEWSDNAENHPPEGEDWRTVWSRKKGRRIWQRRVENEDRWDLPNTLLKMGKKRASIDAALSVTRSSGLFSQDIDEFPSLVGADEEDVAAARVVTSRSDPPARRERPAAGPDVPFPGNVANLQRDIVRAAVRRQEGFDEPTVRAWMDQELARRGLDWTHLTVAVANAMLAAAKSGDLTVGPAPAEEAEFEELGADDAASHFDQI